MNNLWLIDLLYCKFNIHTGIRFSPHIQHYSSFSKLPKLALLSFLCDFKMKYITSFSWNYIMKSGEMEHEITLFYTM